MVRGKGKGKKQTDIGSVDDEKMKVVQVQRRRGRPLKSLKDEVEEKEIVENVGEREDTENIKSSITSSSSTSHELKNPTTAVNGGRKRKRSSIVKETPLADSNGGKKNVAEDSSRTTVGFRQNGSRRKSKPRRAAEVGVECN